MTLAVIAGLLVSHCSGQPAVDGWIGIALSISLLYLGYEHAHEALVPILGQAPSQELIEEIRAVATSVEGVEGVHEIVVHDYGSMLLLSLHVEIPERFGPAKMHETAERCESRLREKLGAAAVCHTDPLMEPAPEVQAIEDAFKMVIASAPDVLDYHDFRVVADSEEKIILVADIDAADRVPESGFGALAKDLDRRVTEAMPRVSYCSFRVTPKFSY